MNTSLALQLTLVGSGGAIGAICRYGLSLLLNSNTAHAQSFPWATFLANMIGCFFIGCFAGYIVGNNDVSLHLKLFFAIGVLGGFTTFSALSLESFNMLQSGHTIMAFSYSISSFLIGIGLCFTGFLLLKTTQ